MTLQVAKANKSCIHSNKNDGTDGHGDVVDCSVDSHDIELSLISKCIELKVLECFICRLLYSLNFQI